MEIRSANIADLDRISEIYAFARNFMKQNGNAAQWGNCRPAKETLLNDIDNKNLYVIENDGIAGVFAFIIGRDKTYDRIEHGGWLSDSTYGTIHRIASGGTEKGIFAEIMDFCENIIPHLRIDTHADNKIMQHLICKHGFRRCGIIYADDGTPRIAYEKLGNTESVAPKTK